MNGEGEILFLFQFTTAVLDSFFHGTFPSSKGEPSTQPLQTLIIFMTPSCTQNIAHMNTKITTNPVILINPFEQTFVKRMNNPTIIDQKLWKGFIPTFGCVQEAVYCLGNLEKFMRCHFERLPNIIWRQSVNFFIQFGFRSLQKSCPYVTCAEKKFLRADSHKSRFLPRHDIVGAFLGRLVSLGSSYPLMMSLLLAFLSVSFPSSWWFFFRTCIHLTRRIEEFSPVECQLMNIFGWHGRFELSTIVLSQLPYIHFHGFPSLWIYHPHSSTFHTVPTAVCGMPHTPVDTVSLSDVFTSFGLQTLLWTHHALHAAHLMPNCAKHCLFTSKCLLSVSRPMFSYSLLRNWFQAAQNIMFSQVSATCVLPAPFSYSL